MPVDVLRHPAEIDDDATGLAGVRDIVIAVPTINDALSALPVKIVVASTSVEEVSATAAQDFIVAVASGKGVIARVSEDQVIAARRH
jgi:hypothetical protein